MGYRNLEIETRGKIAHVWLNRPAVHNALDETSIRELAEAFTALDADPNVHVVVLGGRGPSFCAGGDLNWMKRAAAYTEADNLRDARALAHMFHTIYGLSKPTLARIQGAAIGGGTGLTAVCDIAIATTEAQFGTTEVRLGLAPATIGPFVIAAMGARAAHRYFLTGERFGAEEARRLGIVHEVVAPEDLDRRIDEIIELLGAGGLHAQAVSKRLIARVAHRPIDEAILEYTSQEIAHVRATAEAKEGIAAFVEKRRPQWHK